LNWCGGGGGRLRDVHPGLARDRRVSIGALPTIVCFEILPARAARRKRLQSLATKSTQVLYERRIACANSGRLRAVFGGERSAMVAREITKSTNDYRVRCAISRARRSDLISSRRNRAGHRRSAEAPR